MQNLEQFFKQTEVSTTHCPQDKRKPLLHSAQVLESSSLQREHPDTLQGRATQQVRVPPQPSEQDFVA